MPGYNLRIMAYGDSLTSPAYTDELERIVRAETRNKSAVVINSGFYGSTTFYLEDGFKEDITRTRYARGKPHVAAILGGTNDLGQAALNFLTSDSVISAFNKRYPEESMTPEKLIELANIGIGKIKSDIVDSQIDQSAIADFFKSYIENIFGNLVSMYKQAMEQCVFPIAIAVPPTNLRGFSRKLTIAPRAALNEMIKEHCIKHGIAYVDLFSATAEPETGLMLPEYSADGLHFNEAGYKKMAQVVFEQGVLPFLQQPPIKRMLRQAKGKVYSLRH